MTGAEDHINWWGIQSSRWHDDEAKHRPYMSQACGVL